MLPVSELSTAPDVVVRNNSGPDVGARPVGAILACGGLDDTPEKLRLKCRKPQASARRSPDVWSAAAAFHDFHGTMVTPFEAIWLMQARIFGPHEGDADRGVFVHNMDGDIVIVHDRRVRGSIFEAKERALDLARDEYILLPSQPFGRLISQGRQIMRFVQ